VYDFGGQVKQSTGKSHWLYSALAVLTVVGLLSLVTPAAEADTFNFSFSNDSTLGFPGQINGTVTGQIVGLINNATSAATAVYVDSYPAGLVVSGSYPAPFNVLDWTGGFIGENSFTEVNGAITGGGFDIRNANGVDDQLYIDSSCCSGAGTNFFDIGSNDTQYVWNDNGIGDSGVTFSSYSSDSSDSVATPEPSSLLLLGIGLLGLMTLAIRRKQLALRPALPEPPILTKNGCIAA
jgi:hypothetical protein